jgi:PadR family transcriptional regulator, regulatory protein AphA
MDAVAERPEPAAGRPEDSRLIAHDSQHISLSDLCERSGRYLSLFVSRATIVHTYGVAPTVTVDSLNQTARIVLAMIAEGHTTGYAIKAEIERSTRLYWGASVGGIYPELRRLVTAGLVRFRDDPRGGAVRHCYTLSPQGRDVLHRWLTDPAEPGLEVRDEALLQLRFAGVLDPDEQVDVLRRMRNMHRRRVTDLEALLATDEFDDPFHRMTIEFALGWNQWASDWCTKSERRLSRLTRSAPVPSEASRGGRA